MNTSELSKNKSTPFYERTLLVNSSVQFGLMNYSLFVAFSVTLMNFLIQTIMSGQLNEVLGFEYEFSTTVLFILFATVLMVIFSYGFHLTNKIVGPIYRLKNHMLLIREGKKVAPLEFRKTDYFQEIVQPYNDLLKGSGAIESELE